MNLRDLKYLSNLAKEGHFAKAAKKSFVSQPTLSMQIKKVEEELGVKIFERFHKKLIITPIGQDILQRVEIILRDVEEIKNLAQSAINPCSGQLIIGAFPTLAPYFFPKIVRQISKKFPKLKLLLIEEKTEILIKKLQDGEIDIALLAMPIANKEFDLEELFAEEFLLAVPSNHQFAKKKKINQKELSGLELILLEDGHCLRDQALAVCYKIGAVEKETFRATSLETLRQMIIAGSGITLIPSIAAKKERGISYIKIENPPKRKIGLFFRKSSVKKQLLKEIAQILR